jgi:6-phosphogluconolactonase
MAKKYFYIASCGAATIENPPISLDAIEAENKDFNLGGIYTCYVEDSSNSPFEIESFFPWPNITFLHLSKSGKYLFASCLIDNEPSVASFAVNEGKSLTYLSSMPVNGKSPCYLETNEDETFLYSANYYTGNLTEFELKNGFITRQLKQITHTGCGTCPNRQDMAHIHYVKFTPDKKYLAIVDLGIDAVVCYKFDKTHGIDTKEFSKFTTDKGDGPRHLEFNKNGNIAYLITELGNNVYTLKYNDGNFEKVSKQSCIPSNFDGVTTAAAIRLSENEKFLTASSRGTDTVAVYKVENNGNISLVEIVDSGFPRPRDANFLPNDKYFATCNEEGKVCFFSFDDQIGKLSKCNFEINTVRPLYLLK